MNRLRTTAINTPANFDEMWERVIRIGADRIDKYRFLALEAGILNGDRVLELGPGCSLLLSWLGNRLQIKGTGLDYSRWAMQWMAFEDPRIAWDVGNVLHAPYPDGSFNVVLAGELIEHIDDPESLIAEMARLTRPGGFFRLTTPRPEHAAKSEWHLWSFDRDDWGRLFAPYAKKVTIREVGDYWVPTGWV